MGFMKPAAEHFAAYHVETNVGTEIIPVELCGDLGLLSTEALHTRVLAYCEGSRIDGAITRREGWYARLSAPGYLDCTDWTGPYETEDAALDAVKEDHDVDDNGDDLSEGPCSDRPPSP
jgi:hypothetical protein